MGRLYPPTLKMSGFYATLYKKEPLDFSRGSFVYETITDD